MIVRCHSFQLGLHHDCQRQILPLQGQDRFHLGQYIDTVSRQDVFMTWLAKTVTQMLTLHLGAYYEEAADMYDS